MPQGVGTCTVSVGAGQQIVDRLAAQIEFDLSDGSLVGKLQCQNHAAIAQATTSPCRPGLFNARTPRISARGRQV